MYKILIAFSFSLFTQLVSPQTPARIITDFNKEWRFYLGDDSLAARRNYNDSSWRMLDLPHDWSIEGQFSESNPATTQGGALPGGVGWYRKTFMLSPAQKNKNTSIEFDGIYRNSEVWINGHYLGKRPNGYISFQYDLTSWLLPAPQKNIIAVRVDNSQQPNSRWYTGSGIYRNTRLISTSQTASIAHWGQFVSTLIDPGGAATVKIETDITGNKNARSYTDIYDAKGKLVISVAGSKHEKAVADTTLRYFSVAHLKTPTLWSVDNPYLYKAITRVVVDGKKVDETSMLFGIRDFCFDPLKGFFLNSKPLKILGVCNHHDLGALGAAVNKRAIERQLEILKAMGCNAIRTAHNPPAPELLELCDKMGFLVMVEAFDMWKKKKNKFDYFSDFDQWHKQDMQDMVLRDRNHPSVFMWSIGNEIREQFDSTGITIARELVDIVKSVDSTRPVTAALSEWDPQKNFIYKSGALDIVGLNYHHEVYEDFQKYYPGKSFLGAENMSALETRGYYDFPSDTLMHWPARSPQKFVEHGNPDYTVSAYDQVSAYWGSTHEETWKIIRKHDYLSGLFVWTGFDYLGEPTPYPWPARSSYFGIIDLAGFPKDVYYMYQSEWTNRPVLHIFPHWNWNKGQLVDVWAYYNKADEVELFLNNRSLGIRKKEKDVIHVMWRVPFEPGILKAVSRLNGKTVLTQQIVTAGRPAKIQLIPDRRKIKADGRDLSFITVRILDENNNPVPYAGNTIRFTIDGAGVIEGTDNGYQAGLESFKSNERKCWKGMALVIVKSSEKKGNITLRATADGLQPASIAIKTGD